MAEDSNPTQEKLTTVFTQAQIGDRVKELAQTISADYAQEGLIVVVGVLKGSFIFMADLVRELSIPVLCDFVSLSSYGDGTSSSGKITLHMDLRNSVEGKHVLVVEDIIDSGLTLEYLQNYLKEKKAASIRFCSLLKKINMEKKDLKVVDYVGFSVENEFVVGYGLDHGGRYRELPYIAKK